MILEFFFFLIFIANFFVLILIVFFLNKKKNSQIKKPHLKMIPIKDNNMILYLQSYAYSDTLDSCLCYWTDTHLTTEQVLWFLTSVI